MAAAPFAVILSVADLTVSRGYLRGKKKQTNTRERAYYTVFRVFT